MFGVVWVLILFFPFVRGVCRIVGLDPSAGSQDPARLTFALATFHTCFNLINTAVLIWFIPQIEKFVCRIIKPKKSEVEDEFKLKYIKAGIMKTPELSVFQAQKEIAGFGDKMRFMFGLVEELYKTEDDGAFGKLFERIEKFEDKSDDLENEIGRYLGDVGSSHLSDDTKEKIRSMLRQISELESIGDGCFNLARIIRRKKENKLAFTQSQEDGLAKMFGLVDEALALMNNVLSGRKDDYDISLNENAEFRINACRDKLKSENILSLDAHDYNYVIGTVFNDLVGECEKTGDYIINVVEARFGVS